LGLWAEGSIAGATRNLSPIGGDFKMNIKAGWRLRGFKPCLRDADVMMEKRF